MQRVAAITLLTLAAAGCGSPGPQRRVTFAVVGGVYFSATGSASVEGAVTEHAESLLRKTVVDLNKQRNLDFVLFGGNLFAGADAAGLDCVRAILADLKVPYYVVLGDCDGSWLCTGRAEPGSGAGARPAGGPGASRQQAGPAAISRTALAWAFQGRGFTGPDGYWSKEVVPGLVLVALDTTQPGRRGGYVDQQQLKWLDGALRAATGKTVIVAGYHGLVAMHPLEEGTAWSHRLVSNAEAVRDRIERHQGALMVLSSSHHFAEGRVSGRLVHLSSPALSVWPMAYHLVSLSGTQAEAVWVPVADEATARLGQQRLLESSDHRGVFPAGEGGDTACIRLFGGKKLETYPLPAIRP